MKKFLENFWYHYKWHTLIILFFIVTLAIGLTQVITEKTSYDVYMLYVGPDHMQVTFRDDVVKIFTDAAEKIAKESGDDSPQEVNFQQMVYLTEEVIKKRTEEAEKLGQTYTYHPVANREVLETFMKQMTGGENVILFLEPELYDTARVNSALYKIEEVLGKNFPGTDEKGYGVSLKDSGLTDVYPCLRLLPENSVICFKKIGHAQSMIGKKESDASHKFQLAVAVEVFGKVLDPAEGK